MIRTNEHIFIRDLYLKLFKKAKSDIEKIILAKLFGSFATKNHIGLFRCPEIESFADDFANKHFAEFRMNQFHSNPNVLVHIVTRTYETGGHSRFLENLIQLDTKRIHHLVILDQSVFAPRRELHELIQKQGGEILSFEGEDVLIKGGGLLRFLSQNPAIVFLHHHPEDLFPSLVLPIVKGKMEIMLFNHADHVFSFGFELADKVINIREEAHRMTFHWRNVKNSFVLPLPIIKPAIDPSKAEVTRIKYGLKENQILGLSIGSPHKFKRTSTHHFFGTIYKALEANPNLVVFIVGLDEESTHRFEVDLIPHERLRLLGLVPDPVELQMIAHIAIDPMPFGSYTALLETCYYGALPLVCFGTAPLFNLYDDPAFQQQFRLTLNEQEYLSEFRKLTLMCNPEHKKQTAELIQRYHSGIDWIANFEQLLASTTLDSNCSLPNQGHKLEHLNQTTEDLRYRLLADLYENCHYLSHGNIVRATFRMCLKSYNIKELGGILRKKAGFES
jgi:hypothetical protein